MEVDNKTKEKESISRRSFFKIITIALGTAMSFIIGIPLVESVASAVKKVSNKILSKLVPIKSIPNSFIPIEKPTKLNFVKMERDAFIKNIVAEDVWAVKKTDTDITVFSPICPHLGCRYDWIQEQKLFICPCHNSIFTITGKLVSGPAPRGLDTLPIEKKNGTLYVFYERFKVGIPQKIVIGY